MMIIAKMKKKNNKKNNQLSKNIRVKQQYLSIN
jgi:hypothetical protein